MNEFLQFALLGLGFGALYALAAQGVVLIYRGSGVINFAQGAMGMMGAFVYYTLHYHPVEPGGILPDTTVGILALAGGRRTRLRAARAPHLRVGHAAAPPGVPVGATRGHPGRAHDPVRARRDRPQDR